MSMRMLKRSIPRLWGESSASSSNAQFPGSNSGLAVFRNDPEWDRMIGTTPFRRLRVTRRPEDASFSEREQRARTCPGKTHMSTAEAGARGIGGRRARGLLVGGLVAATLITVAVPAASAVTARRTVALHVTVNGSGTVRVPGHPAFTCHASFPTSSHCRRTFQVRKGSQIVVRESPASGWKLWRWSGACHGPAASCSLRVKARRFGFVTASFVPPGDRLNPYPLGTAATLQAGWQLKVNSALINADTRSRQSSTRTREVPPTHRRRRALSTRSSMCR